MGFCVVLVARLRFRRHGSVAVRRDCAFHLHLRWKVATLIDCVIGVHRPGISHTLQSVRRHVGDLDLGLEVLVVHAERDVRHHAETALQCQSHTCRGIRAILRSRVFDVLAAIHTLENVAAALEADPEVLGRPAREEVVDDEFARLIFRETLPVGDHADARHAVRPADETRWGQLICAHLANLGISADTELDVLATDVHALRRHCVLCSGPRVVRNQGVAFAIARVEADDRGGEAIVGAPALLPTLRRCEILDVALAPSERHGGELCGTALKLCQLLNAMLLVVPRPLAEEAAEIVARRALRPHLLLQCALDVDVLALALLAQTVPDRDPLSGIEPVQLGVRLQVQTCDCSAAVARGLGEAPPREVHAHTPAHGVALVLIEVRRLLPAALVNTVRVVRRIDGEDGPHLVRPGAWRHVVLCHLALALVDRDNRLGTSEISCADSDNFELDEATTRNCAPTSTADRRRLRAETGRNVPVEDNGQTSCSV
mmetsp:Transcript_18086/g.52215  ORF Transcript_18086/g.52215 Transcript_18086/m.52215 type:complete len:487 (+) Transcript_18086:463-1923(+)